MQLAFLVSAVIAIGIVVLATMLPSRPAADPHAAPDLDAELEQLEDGAGDRSRGPPPRTSSRLYGHP